MTTINMPAEGHMRTGTIREIFGPIVMERFGVSPEEFLARYEDREYENLLDEDARWVSMLAPFALTAGYARAIVAGLM